MIQFTLTDAQRILSRTPGVLRQWLSGLPENWQHANEGKDTFSPYDVLGHLIHGEQTDWIPRMNIILQFGESRPFDPYDRFAQYELSKGKNLEQLLNEFETERARCLQTCLLPLAFCQFASFPLFTSTKLAPSKPSGFVFSPHGIPG